MLNMRQAGIIRLEQHTDEGCILQRPCADEPSERTGSEDAKGIREAVT